MVENRLYLENVSDPQTFNLVAKRTIHEVSHQWWGHALTPKPIPGASLLIEGFAKYTEAIIMEKEYGKRSVYTLVEDARLKYFQNRALAKEKEPSVHKVFGQAYISYGKALHVMLALRDLIGEEKVNSVLERLINKFRYTKKLLVTSTDFLNEVYNHTPSAQHQLIDDWFKKLITYDLSVDHSSSYKPLDDGTFEVSVKVCAKRIETFRNRETVNTDIAEPIKMGSLPNIHHW